MKKFWAKKGLRWTVIIVVVLAAGGIAFGGSKPVVYETTPVRLGSVTATVTASGQIKSKEYASLRFKTTGTIGRLLASVGDQVATGQLLAQLDTSELSAKVTQAQADVVSAQVALENSSQEVKDTDIKNTQTLDVLYADAPAKFAEILNSTQQAYATYITFFDSYSRLNSSIANVGLNTQLVIDANNSKGVADGAMVGLRAALENFPLTASRDRIDAALAASRKPLESLQAGLTTLINAVAAVPSGSISAATLEGYVTSLATAKTNLNAAVSKRATLESDIRDAAIQGGLKVNTTAASYRTAQANLEKAKATLAVAQQNLADASLRAPFTGTIAAKDKQIGELVTTSDQVYYLLGKGGLEVIANIPEIDIAHIMVGMKAQITLDAYGKDTVFEAIVSEIDPAETFVDGVATYKVKFELAQQSQTLRSGMTANISILTDSRENVLIVPVRAITTKNGNKIVTVLSGENPSEVVIKTGLRGNDGSVEVVEGLNEGDLIVTGTK